MIKGDNITSGRNGCISGGGRGDDGVLGCKFDRHGCRHGKLLQVATDMTNMAAYMTNMAAYMTSQAANMTNGGFYGKWLQTQVRQIYLH